MLIHQYLNYQETILSILKFESNQVVFWNYKDKWTDSFYQMITDLGHNSFLIYLGRFWVLSSPSIYLPILVLYHIFLTLKFFCLNKLGYFILSESRRKKNLTHEQRAHKSLLLFSFFWGGLRYLMNLKIIFVIEQNYKIA